MNQIQLTSSGQGFKESDWERSILKFKESGFVDSKNKFKDLVLNPHP